MGKKILSLLLALAMVLSVTISCISVSAEENNVVQIKYYKSYTDEGGLAEETDSVDAGTYFYAALVVDKFTDFNAMTVTVGYNTDYVQLVEFNGTTAVEQKGKLQDFLGEEEDDDYPMTEKFGFKMKDTFVPYYINKHFPYVGAEGKNGVISAFWQGSSVTNTEPEVMLIAKFYAKAMGTAEFTFPAYDAEGGQGYASNPKGLKILTVTGEGSTTLDLSNCNNKTAPLKITGRKLAKPENLVINGRNVTWDSVADAASYDVGIEVNGTFLKKENVKNASYVIPADVEYGQVKITVVAVSDQSDVGSSDAAEVETAFVKNLPAPVVKLEGKLCSWDAISGALKYSVVLKKNGVAVAGYPKETTDTSIDLSADIQAPITGSLAYSVEVTAIGDGTYTLDSGAGVSSTLKLLGRVSNVTSVAWDGMKATWTDENNEAGSVLGYGVTLYNGKNIMYSSGEEVIKGKSVDLSKYMTDPGRYNFTVKVYGADTEDGKYEDSDKAVESTEKIVSKKLDNVSGLAWNGRTLSWDDKEGAARAYEVRLYKDSVSDENLVKTYSVTDKKLDFGADIVSGNFIATVKAIGDDVIYKNSDAVSSDVQYFSQPLADATNVKWNGNKATWDAVENAVSYDVRLYYNGVEITLDNNSFAETEVDFSNKVKATGTYTFTVRANAANGYSPAINAVKSDDNDNVAVTKGYVTVSLYSDAECENSVSSIEVGKVFYAAISVKGVEFTSMAIPFKFDAESVKVVGSDNRPVGKTAEGYAVTELTSDNLSESGVILGDMFNGNRTMPLLQNGYSYVDNEGGLLAFGAYSNSVQNVSDADFEKVIVVKMLAISKKNNVSFEFAKANIVGDAFDDNMLAGFEYVKEDTVDYPDETAAMVSIETGKLSTMDAPVWNGTVLSWNKMDGTSVTGYELVIYKDGIQLDKITVSDANTTMYDAASYLSEAGSYTATVKALADGIGAYDGDASAQSEAYTVARRRSSKGGSSASYVTVKFDSNGGSAVASKSVKQGTAVSAPGKPVREGYAFDGWYSDKELTAAYDFRNPVNESITLYAKWKELVELTDIVGHWAEQDIRELVKLGIIDGYDDNTFKPDWGITRAEFTKLIITCLDLKPEENGYVYDDTADHWAKDYIALGTKLGIVNGIGDNKFAPDRIISREEMAAVIYRMAGKPETAEGSAFADNESVQGYAKEAVNYVAGNGTMIGFEDNTFRPAEKTNRAQTATVVLRLVKSGFFDDSPLLKEN